MKHFIVVMSAILLLSACSSKMQTNKIPNDKKYHLPLKDDYKEPKMNEMEEEKFSLFLQKFFAPKTTEEEKNLWKTGAEYFK